MPFKKILNKRPFRSANIVLVTQQKIDSKKLVKYTAWILFLLAVLWWSAVGTNLSVGMLYGGIHGIIDIVGRMLPPDFNRLPMLVGPVLETVQISIWGTLLAIFLSIPLSLLAAKNIAPHHYLYQASRMLLNGLRAIPDVIFALIFVAAVGLGPFPGVLGIGVSSTGMLGKFFADAIENVDTGPMDALQATGAHKLQVIAFAIVPQILPEFISVSLFRWEMNFRASTIVGIVGAGGIGFELMTSMRLFRYQEMTVILILILVIVTVVDTLSSFIRKRVI